MQLHKSRLHRHTPDEWLPGRRQGNDGSPHASAVSSCTAALELAALLCRLQPGDEVITPAHTFAASVIPFARTGARPVWADIDPDTGTEQNRW